MAYINKTNIILSNKYVLHKQLADSATVVLVAVVLRHRHRLVQPPLQKHQRRNPRADLAGQDSEAGHDLVVGLPQRQALNLKPPRRRANQ